jgi:formylglycine-generating enzyme required for sulfatase activity
MATCAKSFVTWLSKKNNRTYRLLTEAEWEYVARAGSTTAFWWGPTVSPKQANYNSAGEYGSYGGSEKAPARNQTAQIKSFAANAFGLHNVHGNVFEWVEDCWFDDYTGAPTDGSVRVFDNCTHTGSCVAAHGALVLLVCGQLVVRRTAQQIVVETLASASPEPSIRVLPS